MVDDMDYMDNGSVAVDGGTSTTEAASSAAGSNRLVIIIAAIVGLLAVAGLVAAAVFIFVLNDTVDTIPPVPGGVSESPSTSEGAMPAEPPAVALKRVFTFRDIFNPLILPLPEQTPGGSVVPTDGTSVPGLPDGDPGVTLPAGTLFLRDIMSVDGVTVAVLYLDGQTYSLPVGGVISGTPWQVQSISGNSVIMLYGDVQVTLTVGQGVVTSTK